MLPLSSLNDGRSSLLRMSIIKWRSVWQLNVKYGLRVKFLLILNFVVVDPQQNAEKQKKKTLLLPPPRHHQTHVNHN